MSIGSNFRIIDANLNRLREGIRVIEDIARYILNDYNLASRLKDLRHKARITSLESLLNYRDIKNDVLKTSTPSEKTRENLCDIALANFKRTQESARVLEEIFKLDSLKDLARDLGESNYRADSDNFSANCSSDSAINEVFKAIRYELYDIEIAYFVALDKI